MSYVSNDGVKIHYEVEGNGPALVLHHGLYGTMEDWREWGFVDALKDDYKVILIDSRGHGKSDKPHDPRLYTHYLRSLDVVKVLDVLGVEKSHYAGFSMGGWCAFGLMRWFEPRFSSFIVMAAHPFENDMRGMHEGIRTMDQWVPAEIASAAMRERNLANDREALMAACHDGRVDQTAVLKGLSTPCMVIAGDKDEIYEKVKEGALSSDRIEFVTIPGADHIGLLYSCDAVVPHVLRFLGNIK
jgi:pimeloyl-ACP methyl ester carboxylesterase